MTEKLVRGALALWVGGVAAIDGVESRARFRAVDRESARAVGREVFKAMNRYELALAALALPAALRGPRWKLFAIAVMSASTIAQAFLLRPWMERLVSEPDFAERLPETMERYDTLHKAFGELHAAYAFLDLLKILLGLPTLLD